MKKSQIFGIPTTYVMVVIIAAIIIFFGVYAIRSLNESNSKTQTTNFVLSLQNKLTANRANVGSVSPETFALPTSVKSVCFVDAHEMFMPFVNKKLSERREAFSEHNLFIEPFDRESPYKLDYLHIDEAENPLCLKVTNGKLRVVLQGEGNITRLSPSNENQKEEECVSVIYNRAPEDSIDIVFLGYGYSNTQSFASDINKYTESTLFEMEPFKSNKDKINVYRVDDFNLDCAVGDWISCKQYSTNLAASNCPNDYVVVLTERGLIKDTISPVRSSAVGNTVKINTAPSQDKFVLMHELGHTIGGLADEYTDQFYSGFDASKYPNCDITPCNKWRGVEGTGCLMGCSNNLYYRSIETSIMKDIKEPYEYGPVNTNALIGVFNKYGGQNE